jgi:hypothetical protein
MSSLDTGNVLGIFAILFSIGGVIYTAVNHKRFRLKCCGKDLDVSVDVEDTTPPAQTKQTKTKALNPKDINAIGNKNDEEEEEEEEEEDRKDEKDEDNSQRSINGTNKTFKEKERPAKEKERESERERERRVSMSQRDQNIEERERSEVLKANYALRVAEARRYNSNQKRIAPLPPQPPLHTDP